VKINWEHTLSPVRNQGICGSCWAFSTMGAVESAFAIKNNAICPHLSTQQLIDCETNSFGCNGGYAYHAINFLSNQGGAMLESDYPYEEEQGSCRFNRSLAKIKVKSMAYCEPGFYGNTPCNKAKWLSLLAKGSVSVLVSSNEILQHYGGGIISLQAGQCENYDHAVVAFAFRNNQGREVISVRNSMGPEWGDKGNFHIYYNPQVNDTCWITKVAFLPIL